MVAPASPARFGIVGSGWRAELFLRLAHVLPERFEVCGVVTRTESRGGEVADAWGVRTFRTVGELLTGTEPDFVITSVPWEVTPRTVRELVALQMPVLAETPPAPDLPGLRALWADVGASGLVQVAEQYMLYPGHRARAAVARRGVIGDVTSVQVSSTHEYHAMSMIRALLDVGFADARIVARESTAPLADPFGRGGPTGDGTPKQAVTTMALIDFGGRTALYDFTDNQWFNPLRTRRIVIRGSLGEIADDRVTHLANAVTVIESDLVRRHTGIDLNLEGFDLDHISFEGEAVFRNPYQGARLADDEIAVATLLDRMLAWCRGDGDPPYPLADGCQDHYLSQAIAEAVRTRGEVRTGAEPWVDAVSPIGRRGT
jgi:predicted dehydrogenase